MNRREFLQVAGVFGLAVALRVRFGAETRRRGDAGMLTVPMPRLGELPGCLPMHLATVRRQRVYVPLMVKGS